VPRFQQGDRAHIRRARPWQQYAYHIEALPARLGELARTLPLGAGARVLDYGCPDVPYRAFFAAGADYVAADLPGNPHSTLTLNADGSVPADDASFDAVLSTQVLEHAGDPALHLAEAFRVLRPGGALLLSTHGIFPYHPDPDDYWRWTRAGLRRAVERAGFQVVRVENVIGLLPTGLQLVEYALYWRLPRFLRPPFALLMESLIRLTDRLFRDEYDAQVFALVARRP
jgi:SAM-dependent methyltransferase